MTRHPVVQRMRPGELTADRAADTLSNPAARPSLRQAAAESALPHPMKANTT